MQINSLSQASKVTEMIVTVTPASKKLEELTLTGKSMS